MKKVTIDLGKVITMAGLVIMFAGLGITVHKQNKQISALENNLLVVTNTVSRYQSQQDTNSTNIERLIESSAQNKGDWVKQKAINVEQEDMINKHSKIILRIVEVLQKNY